MNNDIYVWALFIDSTMDHPLAVGSAVACVDGFAVKPVSNDVVRFDQFWRPSTRQKIFLGLLDVEN